MLNFSLRLNHLLFKHEICYVMKEKFVRENLHQCSYLTIIRSLFIFLNSLNGSQNVFRVTDNV